MTRTIIQVMHRVAALEADTRQQLGDGVFLGVVVLHDEQAAGGKKLEGAGGKLTTHEGQPFMYGKTAERFRNGWFVARGAS